LLSLFTTTRTAVLTTFSVDEKPPTSLTRQGEQNSLEAFTYTLRPSHSKATRFSRGLGKMKGGAITRRDGEIREMTKKILVVDDDPDNRTALCMMLHALGHSTVPFGSGREALAFLDTTPDVDLIMLDVMMPEMNGYEVLASLRTREECAATPVVMVTACDTASQVLQGYQQGADYYITKPLTLEQLRYGLAIYFGSK
jgi:CheY-like chemotaxis protein